MDKQEQEAYDFMNQPKIPPLGIMPRQIWESRRVMDILKAMDRYVEANTPIPLNWVEEYNELIKKLNSEGVKNIGK